MSQAETPFRKSIDDISNIYVRNAAGTMVPMRALAQAASRARPATARALQRLSRRHHQRRAEARLQLGPGARRDGAHLGSDPAGRLQLRVDGHRPSGEGGRRRRARRARPRAAVRLSLPRGPLRELEHSDSRAAVGQRRRPRRHRRGGAQPGAASTSIPRSGSWC